MSQNDKLIPLTEDDLAPVSGGAGVTSGVSMSNIQSMDIETALMMVQSERTKLLDTQLKTQLSEVEARKQSVGGLNDALQTITAIGSALTGDQVATTTTKVSGKEDTLGTAFETLAKIGVDTKTFTAMAEGGFTKGELGEITTKVKGMLDSQNNSLQMDTLRLQSMTNKRDEAFDVMTNFVKKMQESRSSIIGNMR